MDVTTRRRLKKEPNSETQHSTSNVNSILEAELKADHQLSSSASINFFKSQFQFWMYLCIIFALSGFIICYGLHLRSNFVNGDCCDMTYSRYQFVPIEMKRPFNHVDGDIETKLFESRYRLLKFVDSRDPRGRSILRNLYKSENGQSEKPKKDRETSQWPLDQFSDWCSYIQTNNPGHIVLFVPGHWGTYEQARSLGAHGLRLTGERLPLSLQNEIVSSIRRHQTNANATGDQFLYDVYALDFDGGEGSAFHGSILNAQANFVRQAIETLVVSIF